MLIFDLAINVLLSIIGLAALYLALSCGLPTESELRKVFGTPMEQQLALRITIALVIAAFAASGSVLTHGYYFFPVHITTLGSIGTLWIFRIAPGMGNGGHRWT